MINISNVILEFLLLRLEGNPQCVDEIDKYVYNGLIGAMKPYGRGFVRQSVERRQNSNTAAGKLKINVNNIRL
jgi:hypothetical protein